MDKEYMFKQVYHHFVNAVHAYYLSRGDGGSVIFKWALDELKEKAKSIGLTVVVERNGEDIILIVEKPEEYVIVSADLDLYTYEDEEMEEF